MLDKRPLRNVIDKDKVVWQCIVCRRLVIGDRYIKPTKCSCSNGEFVIKGDLIVTKRMGE